jgi:hypothetical protein
MTQNKITEEYQRKLEANKVNNSRLTALEKAKSQLDSTDRIN